MTQEIVKSALSKVMYPGFTKDIVTFGFVNNIKIDGNDVSFDVEITSSAPEVAQQIFDDATKELKAVGAANVTPNIKAPKMPEMNTQTKSKNITPQVKNFLMVSSGKGGVGKSTIALNLAAALSNAGCKTGLLDLDIYGPSLPITMGINENPEVNDSKKIIPLEKNNLKLMSFGFISGNQAPVVWRGPLVAKMTEQFFRDVVWGDLDYLILDLPPGTGDVQLTLSQKIPLDGAIIVTTPNDIALADVRKGADMFKKVETDLLGVVENMSYMNIKGAAVNSADSHIIVNDEKIPVEKDGSFQLKFHLFKKGGGLDESKRLNIPFLAEIPYSNDLMKSIDDGNPIVFQEKDSEIKNIFVDLAKKVMLL